MLVKLTHGDEGVAIILTAKHSRLSTSPLDLYEIPLLRLSRVSDHINQNDNNDNI